MAGHLQDLAVRGRLPGPRDRGGADRATKRPSRHARRCGRSTEAPLRQRPFAAYSLSLGLRHDPTENPHLERLPSPYRLTSLRPFWRISPSSSSNESTNFATPPPASPSRPRSPRRPRPGYAGASWRPRWPRAPYLGRFSLARVLLRPARTRPHRIEPGTSRSLAKVVTR